MQGYIKNLKESNIKLKAENVKLRNEKIELHMKYIESSNAYEESLGLYSELAKECIKIKSEMCEVYNKYEIVCQQKDKEIIDLKMEYAHLKIKIKLLEEVLTKRNKECKELENKLNQNVI